MPRKNQVVKKIAAYFDKHPGDRVHDINMPLFEARKVFDAMALGGQATRENLEALYACLERAAEEIESFLEDLRKL